MTFYVFVIGCTRFPERWHLYHCKIYSSFSRRTIETERAYQIAPLQLSRPSLQAYHHTHGMSARYQTKMRARRQWPE